jgi:hypothetical protein
MQSRYFVTMRQKLASTFFCPYCFLPSGPLLAGVLWVRASRRPISKGGCGMQIILKKFFQREKLGILGKFLDLSKENPFGFGLKQNKLTDSFGFSDWGHFASHISRHELSTEL